MDINDSLVKDSNIFKTRSARVGTRFLNLFLIVENNYSVAAAEAERIYELVPY
jgi:hypothetical protein